MADLKWFATVLEIKWLDCMAFKEKKGKDSIHTLCIAIIPLPKGPIIISLKLKIEQAIEFLQ